MSYSLVPSLRFKGFNEPLTPFPLIKLAENNLSNGVFNDAKLVGSGYKLINVKDIYVGDKIEVNNLTLLNIGEPEFKRNQVKYGDIFFTRSSIVPSGIAYSNVNLSSDDDLTFDGHLMKMSPDQELVEPYYLSAKFKTWTLRKRFISRGKQSTMTTIGQSDIADIPVEIPSKEEQQKIASFLTSVDSKISQLTEMHRLLKEYKKGVMQQIFSQQLRFKDEDGKAFPEWKARLFSEFINAKSELPTKLFSGDLCSLTIKNGIEIKPSRYIREHLVKDIESAYKVVQVGDFVINPMNVRFGALGVNHHYKPVLISKYYDVFECDKTVNHVYFEIYLLSQQMLNHYNRVATGTLEEKKRVHFSEFLKFKKELPCLQEQQKIAQFLQSIDKKIDAVAQQVEQTKQFKKGLLQQMFV
ncbi:restriction endonuclease subunit S [Photobacterium profundum]|uniref:restriction endonuclease subunit S n=1 Tax=Photobacterium profundum TaxID=74109 RepID=UPI003D0E6E11